MHFASSLLVAIILASALPPLASAFDPINDCYASTPREGCAFRPTDPNGTVAFVDTYAQNNTPYVLGLPENASEIANSLAAYAVAYVWTADGLANFTVQYTQGALADCRTGDPTAGNTYTNENGSSYDGLKCFYTAYVEAQISSCTSSDRSDCAADPAARLNSIEQLLEYLRHGDPSQCDVSILNGTCVAHLGGSLAALDGLP